MAVFYFSGARGGELRVVAPWPGRHTQGCPGLDRSLAVLFLVRRCLHPVKLGFEGMNLIVC